MTLGARPEAQAQLDRVLSAWRLSPASHQFEQPADDSVIAAAEQAMGRPLPEALKVLYRIGNGMSTLGGNLGVEPLTPLGEGGPIGLGDRLRSWRWPIPPEVLVFGDNGAGDQFGLWYPPGALPSGPTPVVMIGQVFEPETLAVAGTDLPSFLLAWSGFYLVLAEAPEAALDALGLPVNLRQHDEDGSVGPYFRWADPTLPDPEPNPYERGLDGPGIAAQIAAFSGEIGAR